MKEQLSFLEDIPDYKKTYKPLLTAAVNGKGVMDVDTVNRTTATPLCLILWLAK